MIQQNGFCGFDMQLLC